MDNNWFLSRGKKVLSYQEDAISKVQDSLLKNEKTLLAAAPSAGKTLMTIYIIEKYLKDNPNNKIIVLTHGTTVLRTQFHDVIVENNPDFTYDLIESSEDYNNSTGSVIITLPQTLKNCNLKKADLLIVDEAHHFYVSSKGNMVKHIIKQTKVTKELLLTGTPSKFIYENTRLKRNEYNIIPVALNTIFDEGMVSEAYVEVASSTYDFTFNDYNLENYEIKPNVKIKSIDTKNTLDELLKQIEGRLRGFKGNVYTNITPNWKILLSDLKKTMIACRSVSQAKQVEKYFVKKNIKCALSTSDNDKDSLEIKKFKEDDKCLVLIVVYRGVLGFNMETLVNVVDMTMSYNIDRIYQLFSRVIRLDRNNLTKKKLFFKIAPDSLTDYFKHIMTAMLMLSDEEYFIKFNGKNFQDMEILVKKINKPTRNNTNNNIGKIKSTIKKNRKYQPIDMNGLPVFEFFKNVLHKKNKLLSTYAMTSIRDVRSEFLNRMPRNFWTKEKCISSALKYNTINDWIKNDRGAYAASHTYKWFDECTKHMLPIINKTSWTKEKCLKSALKYKTINDWIKNDANAYAAAYRNNWIIECTQHMISYKPIIKWTKENCLKSALKYKTKSEWRKNEGSAYTTAYKKKWFDECTKHMLPSKKRKNNYWTKEKCISSALKYKTKSEWQKNESGAYDAARRNGWFNECTKHTKIKIMKV